MSKDKDSSSQMSVKFITLYIENKYKIYHNLGHKEHCINSRHPHRLFRSLIGS